jgi:uncharacterized membrane protein
MLAILSLPSPLHPAVVHFPIVLILFGAVFALPALFLPRWHLPIFAAALLALGAIGTALARQSGEHDGKNIRETPAIERVLDRHEEWAERTLIAAIVAAVLAFGVVATSRWPAVSRSLAVATVAAAFVSTWCVVETGHYGGQLVYGHGAGVTLSATGTPGASANQAAIERKAHRKNDDD